MVDARVATASESAECERVSIAAGASSGELMRQAGNRVAQTLIARFPLPDFRDVVIATGPGNNGGDGWVIAGALTSAGYDVRVVEAGSVRSRDARNARAEAVDCAPRSTGTLATALAVGSPRLVVDALLGTGSTGLPRDNIAAVVSQIASARAAGAKVVSVDVPSGLDATTGSARGSVTADLTLTLGTVKRGLLLARERCGEINLLDIGLVDGEEYARLPVLIDAHWVHANVPRISRTAHKGARKRLAIVGGGKGMAGATILAGRGALRAGIGLLQIVVDRENVASIHTGVPQALGGSWPQTADEIAEVVVAADAIAIGPGLGRSAETRNVVEQLLLAFRGPVILDADALNIFEGDTESLRMLLARRPAVLTPHPAELGRLLGISTGDVVEQCFDVGGEFARYLGATILLKGTPTVVFGPQGKRFVVVSGTAALATGGSGDILTGICGTLVSQMADASIAAACAAFIHGRAAELCGGVRGTTLDDVLDAMPMAWNENPPSPELGILATLDAAI